MIKRTLMIIGLAGLWVLGGALAAPAADTMQQAMALYQQRADLAKAAQAADLLDKLIAQEPDNEAAVYRLASTCYWVGKHQKDDDDQIKWFERGINACQKFLAKHPESVPVNYMLGVNWSVYGKAKGISKSLDLVDPIKEKMNFVISKDPGYENGGAYRVLGRIYFKLPGLFGGDNDKSIANLRKAVELGPQRWLNHLYLAETLLDEDKDAEARKLLEQIIAGPAMPEYQPEWAEEKAEAQKMLKDM